MTRKTPLSTLLLASLFAMGSAHALDDTAGAQAGASAAAEAAATAEGQAQVAQALADAVVAAGAYADTDVAMQALVEARDAGSGWGEIAAAHGLDLGLVMADAVSAGRAASGVGFAVDHHAQGSGHAGLQVDTSGVQVGAGAGVATSTRARADVGQDAAARARTEARTDARIDTGLRGSASGRASGRGAATLPLPVTRPVLPTRPLLR